MQNFSLDDIERAENEAFKMRENSKFDDYSAYKCNCRFEKKDENSHQNQNGSTCQKDVKKNMFDDDKMLILVLILLLSKNSNDKLLMAALLYIIM